MRKPNPPAAYHSLAEQRGFTWLGPLPQNKVTRLQRRRVADASRATLQPCYPPNREALTNWQCKERHRWAASYQEIVAGQRCGVCEA
jgi:hypothetical protein